MESCCRLRKLPRKLDFQCSPDRQRQSIDMDEQARDASLSAMCAGHRHGRGEVSLLDTAASGDLALRKLRRDGGRGVEETWHGLPVWDRVGMTAARRVTGRCRITAFIYLGRDRGRAREFGRESHLRENLQCGHSRKPYQIQVPVRGR